VAKLIIREEYCKSCGNCVNACPKKALSISSNRRNKNSYPVVEVNDELCVKCGTCYLVCPDYVFEIQD
jgi:2-oxoglutarate ferredoxin oxidoreductase subunit delta